MNEPESVPTLIDDFLTWMFEESPTAATFAGVPGYDDRLADLSEASIRRREQDEDDWDRRFVAAAPATDDESVDRDLVRSQLAGRRIMRDWLEWRRTPDAYLSAGLMGAFTLFLRQPLPEPELVDAACSRLEAVPSLVEAMVANLDPSLADPRLIRRGVGQARSGIAYVRDMIPAEVAGESAQARIAEAGGVAGAAYEQGAEWLEGLAERATGTAAVGEERYSALLRDKELLGFGAAELRELGQAQVEELSAEMRTVAREGFDTDDFRSALRGLAEDRPTTPEEMRDGYEKWTMAARQFLVDHELVTLPETEVCAVLPAPVFSRPVLAVASYFPPPAFGQSLSGIFNVPYPPEGTTDEQLAQRLADNNYPSMPTTSVHEVYPGHHYHFATLQVSAAPVRRVLTSTYFVEGWALYAERMMRERGFFAEPAHDLAHLDARLFRAARIVVDTGFHCFGMSFDDAVTYMRDVAGLTEAVATAEVTRYSAWPTQAAGYLTGSIEIERMRARWFDTGAGDLRTFHDRIAGSGAMPIALAERALFA